MDMASQKKFDVGNYPYTLCREQHVWTPYDAAIDQKAKVGYRIQKCAHCPTKKHSIVSLRAGDQGALLKPARYSYPRDYRVAGGISRDTKGAIRAYNFLQEFQAAAEG